MMRQKVRIPSILSALFFALCGLMSLYLTYKTAGNLLDSDASSELVLARLLADTNQILSRDWFYSTELRVLNTQLIYMPLFKIFSDWKLVRFFGALLLQAILVLSYYFLSRQAGFSRNVFFLTGGLLLLPASTPYARIVLLHSYYVPHIAIGFFLLGLLLGFGNSEKKKGLRIAYLVLFLLLSLLSGLGGVRQLLVTFLPLLAAAFLLLLCSDGFRGVTHEEMEAGSVSALRRLRTAACCREARTLYLSAAGAAFAAVGYLLNSRVLDGIYSFTNYGGMRLKNPAVGDVDPLFSALLELFGYKANAKVFSKEGIASLLGAARPLLRLYTGAQHGGVFTDQDDPGALLHPYLYLFRTAAGGMARAMQTGFPAPVVRRGRPGRGRLFREQPSHHALLCQKTAGFPDCLQRARLYRKGHGGASDTGRRLPAG